MDYPESFDCSNPIMNNKQLRSALNSGVDGIHLSLVNENEKAHIGDMLLQVLVELIHIHVTIDLPSESIIQFLKQQNAKAGIIEYPDINPNTLELIHQHLPLFRSIYLKTDDINSSDGIKRMFQEAKEFLVDFKDQAWSNTLPQKFAFEIPIGPDFKREIAKLRAFQIVWANLLGSMGYDQENNQAYIIAKIGQDLEPTDSHSNMIRQTTRCMSAVIGGSSIISILPSNKNIDDPFTNRISRNVHHLLKMESFLDKVSDPSAGSYAIDYETKKYCDVLWNNIK